MASAVTRVGLFVLDKHNMKKIIILGLLIFLIPQITLAAWWNPTTWFNNWKFNTVTENKTQALENRVKELEQKLEKPTVTTSTKTQPLSVTKPPVINAPQPKPVVLQPKELNMVQPAIKNYKDEIIYIDGIIDSFAIVYKNINESLGNMEGYRATYKELIRLGSLGQSFVDVVNDRFDGYESDIRKSKKSIDDYVQQLRSFKEDAKSQISKIENLYITSDDLLSFRNTTSKKDSELYTAARLVSDQYFDLLKKIRDDSDVLEKSIYNQTMTNLDAKIDYKPVNCVAQKFIPGATGPWFISCY